MVRCMHRTNIYLDDFQVSALDALAAHEGVARAEVVRRLIDRGLGRSRDDSAADLRAINESFGSIDSVIADERTPDDRSAYLDRLWRQ